MRPRRIVRPAFILALFPQIRERLTAAVHGITVPVRVVQPPRDASREPVRVLGDEARKIHKDTFITKVYPATMPSNEQEHCFGGAPGFHNWASDAVEFFDGVLGVKRGQ